MTLTDVAAITGGSRSTLGYWQLAAGPGEPRQHRFELLPHPWPALVRDARPLLTVAHLSDMHLCDSQSPGRGEFMDRWSDPDSELRPILGHIGAYRAQDCLTAQVGAAMVDAINKVGAGPVGGAEIDWAITTGDSVDSAQRNELDWYIALLTGGEVVPDSGSAERYEGVADHDHWHEAYWHPDPASDEIGAAKPDRPRRLFGFPDAPGLLDALRQPLHSPGLDIPWLAVHGNHDQLVQGNISSVGQFSEGSMSDIKAIDVPGNWTLTEIAEFCGGIDAADQHGLDRWPEMVGRPVTPDLRRHYITRAEFVAAHFTPSARPYGHGFARPDSALASYRTDHERVTVLVLDTVNDNGGYQGSLDADQHDWLEAELTAADRERRYVVLASHHTLPDLVNGRTTPGARARVLAGEVGETLDAHPSLVLWLNGHTHITLATAHTGRHAWWEVTAPSLIDFPQQGRIIELLRSPGGTLTVAATMVDHSGEVPWSGRIDTPLAMAGLSRQLAANDWQFRPDDFTAHPTAGRRADRNVLLHLPDPFPG